MLQGHGALVSEQHNDPNRINTNTKYNVVQDSINNTCDKIVLLMHTNLNCNVVQDSIKNIHDTIVL